MNNSLGRISKGLRVSKSLLIRKILESYIKFFDESKAIGGQTHFDAEKTMTEWISERYDMSECRKEILQMNKMIQNNSKFFYLSWTELYGNILIRKAFPAGKTFR